jgi:hypothetical protein
MVGTPKKLYIRTFGCQMNVADSELMAQVLGQEYALTPDAEDADLYLINTCAIRRKSEERSLLGSLKAEASAPPYPGWAAAYSAGRRAPGLRLILTCVRHQGHLPAG